MNSKQQIDPVHTSALLRGLFQAPRLEAFLESEAGSLNMPPLHEYISALCEQKGVPRIEVIRRSGLERSYGFQIFQGTKNPSRDKLLQLAIGFDMGYDQTQALLKIARSSALYPRFKRDAAIIFCLNKHLGFTETQELLARIGMPILGKELGA